MKHAGKIAEILRSAVQRIESLGFDVHEAEVSEGGAAYGSGEGSFVVTIKAKPKKEVPNAEQG
jgi:hypothetical protein